MELGKWWNAQNTPDHSTDKQVHVTGDSTVIWYGRDQYPQKAPSLKMCKSYTCIK